MHVIPDTDPKELESENESSCYDEDEDATDQDKHTISPKQDQKPKDALDGKGAQLLWHCKGNLYDSNFLHEETQGYMFCLKPYMV